MWILYILGALLLLITLILLLPVRVIIKTDQSGEPQFLFKVLFITFGKSNKKPPKKTDSSKTDTPAPTQGLKNLKQQIKEKGLKNTVSRILGIIKDIATEAVGLLRHCTAEKFEFRVVVSGDDAAAAAIKYGAICAVMHPLITAIGSIITIKEKGTHIDVVCDYSGSNEKINYNFVIKLRVFRALVALCRFMLKYYKRKSKNESTSKPNDIVS